MVLDKPTITSPAIADASNIQAAGLTNIGVIEIATAAETTTGTDATRSVSPDGLAGSDFGKREMQIIVVDSATALTTGDGKSYARIPSSMAGYNLVGVAACVQTVSSSGLPSIMIHNDTDNTDMLSTAITIDANGKDSSTATTPPVINTTYDDVTTADQIRIDIDAVGTGTKGLIVQLTFQLP